MDRKELNTLTGVYIANREPYANSPAAPFELIGYIDQHPFIVLRELIDKYRILGYDGSWIKKQGIYYESLYLHNEGYSYSYTNYTKPKVKDITLFCEMFADKLNTVKLTERDYDIRDLRQPESRRNDIWEACKEDSHIINMKELKYNKEWLRASYAIYRHWENVEYDNFKFVDEK